MASSFFNSLGIHYQTKKVVETIGNEKLSFMVFQDLNQTIDDVFHVLEQKGRGDELNALCPYFGVIWPAAHFLAEFLSTYPETQWQEKKVLELGCGLALPSFIAAKKGAQVLSTDFHPEVPYFFHFNQELNQIDKNQLQYQSINWQNFTLDEHHPFYQSFDYLMASDVLYEDHYALQLPTIFSKLLKKNGRIIFTDPNRWNQNLNRFLKAMKDHQFYQGEEELKKGEVKLFQFSRLD